LTPGLNGKHDLGAHLLRVARQRVSRASTVSMSASRSRERAVRERARRSPLQQRRAARGQQLRQRREQQHLVLERDDGANVLLVGERPCFSRAFCLGECEKWRSVRAKSMKRRASPSSCS
jgi:hypothetical protein